MLDIVGSTAAMNIDSSGNAFITIDRGATNDVGQIEFKTAGSAKWYVGMTDSGNFSDGTEFYIGEGSGAASDRHLIIDASGNIEFQAANAKISGSSTSTGSFGLLQTTDRIQTPSDSLKVKGNLTLDNTNIPTLHLDGLVDAIVRIDKAASYRAAQLRFDTAGSADWFIGTPDSDNYGDGDELYFGTSADTPIVAIDPNASTGLLNLTSNKISGSATSTGSFGKILGDGSEITGISTTPFPFTGSATISGSLTVSNVDGKVFEVTSELTGSLFSVSTISGIPALETFDDYRTVGRFERPMRTHTTNFTASAYHGGYYNIVSASLTCSIVHPDTASVAIGTEFEFFVKSNDGRGLLFQTQSMGTTQVLSKNNNMQLAGQYSGATLKKVDTDTWHLVGDLT